MMKNYLIIACLLFTQASAAAIAADKPFSGIFQGTGRQCHGKLSVNSNSIEWRTPFAACNKSPYKIIKKDMEAAKPEIAYLLKGKQRCDFRVIALDWDPEYPDYWNATGYKSQSDYESKSDDQLRCNMEKLKNKTPGPK